MKSRCFNDCAPPKVLLAIHANRAFGLAERCEIVKLDLRALDRERLRLHLLNPTPVRHAALDWRYWSGIARGITRFAFAPDSQFAARLRHYELAIRFHFRRTGRNRCHLLRTDGCNPIILHDYDGVGNGGREPFNRVAPMITFVSDDGRSAQPHKVTDKWQGRFGSQQRVQFQRSQIGYQHVRFARREFFARRQTCSYGDRSDTVQFSSLNIVGMIADERDDGSAAQHSLASRLADGNLRQACTRVRHVSKSPELEQWP